MPNLLKNLELEELSLVDRPANAQAMVSLFKRDTLEENPMEKEEIEKMQTEVAALKAEVEKAEALKTENERLRKALIENGFVIKADAVEKKEAPEMIDVDGTLVAKSDIPEAVLKALEASKEAVAKAEKERAEVALTKRAKETLPHFDEAVAKSLMAFDLDEAIMEALKAADALFAAQMEEVGKSDVNGEFATPNDALEAMVKAHMEANKMTKGQYAIAYAEVAKTEAGKNLINKIYKGE